jgi:hypothetical protein
MGYSRVSQSRRPGSQADDATRHLCAGVYLDRVFRDLVLRKVHNDPDHRVAPSYGFDLVPVVVRAWRAKRLEVAEQVSLLAILIAGLVLAPLGAITAACVIGLCWLAPQMLKTAPPVIKLAVTSWFHRQLHRHGPAADGQRLREQRRLLTLSTAGCVVLLVLPVLLAATRKIPLWDLVRPAALILLLMAVVAAVLGAAQQAQLNRLHTAASLRPATLTRRQAVIDEQQSHLYVVFQRQAPKDETDELAPLADPGDEPGIFVGSGLLLHRWLPPLVIELLRPGPGSKAERGYTEPPFDAHELVEHLRSEAEALRDAPRPMGLPGLQVADRIYIAETDVSHDRQRLSASPDLARVHDVIDHRPDGTAHLLEMSVTTSGELVTTIFLGVTVQGKSLTLHFATCALTQTPAQYHEIDAFAESGTGAILRAALRGVLQIPAELGRSWRLVELPVLLARGARARKDRTLVPRRRVAIGTQLSIRQEKSTPWADSERDEPLILEQMKIIEQRLLSAAEDFLTDRKVDVSLFQQSANTYISANVLSMGGRMEIRDSVVGPKGTINQYNGGDRNTGGPSPKGEKP